MIDKQTLAKRYDDSDDKVCLVDYSGNMLWTNKAWITNHSGKGAPITDNYITVCSNAKKSGDYHAEEVLNGILTLIAGKTEHFIYEYPCHTPEKKQYFMLVAERIPYANDVGFAILIIHYEITDRLIEIRRRVMDSHNKVIKQIMADAAHHWRQLLNVMSFAAYAVNEDAEKFGWDNNETCRNLELILRCITSLSEDIDKMKEFYLSDDGIFFSLTESMLVFLTKSSPVLAENNINVSVECLFFGNYENTVFRNLGKNIRLKCGLGFYNCTEGCETGNIYISGEITSFFWLLRNLFLYHHSYGDLRLEPESESTVDCKISENCGCVELVFSYSNIPENMLLVNNTIEKIFRCNFKGTVSFEKNRIVLRFSEWKSRRPL